MINKKTYLGMLVTVLVFGITVIGCDLLDKEKDILDLLDFRTSTPSQKVLDDTDCGLTRAQFNEIKNAAGGGFKGWALDRFDNLVMAWTGRKMSNYNNLVDVLDEIFEFEAVRSSEPDEDDGTYKAFGVGYWVKFYSTRYTEDGHYASAGTTIVEFW